MKRLVSVLPLLVLMVSSFVHAQAPATVRPTQTVDRLPVRRVVLYKSGVGYFEHVGRVRGNQDVTIEFTSGQLDDVLKSLTVLDLDGGRVTNVGYNSEAGLDRRLGALRLPIGANASRTEFLSALRGARLEVRTAAGKWIGRLLSVEKADRQANGVTTSVDTLSLVSDDGDVRTVPLESGVTVHIVDAELNQEVSRYLALVGSTRDQDVRRLTIATAGTGDRDVFVSYVSEVPVWKATYRLVLPSTNEGQKPILQGWAIVDNTVGQDWTNVQLSLVAGAPQSFIQQISRPYYIQRPVVGLPERALLSPQTHQGAMTTAPANPGYFSTVVPRLDAVEEVTLNSAFVQTLPRGGAGGGGRGGGVVGLPSAQANITIDGVSGGFGRVQIPQPAPQTDVTAGQLGDLFEYKLKEPITIRKNQSALVPIAAGEVEAERVSLWTAGSRTSRPLRAVWLKNTTALTLDAGSFSVIDGQAFAGEGLMESLKPGERRLLSYAMDSGLTVDAKGDASPRRITSIKISRGLVIQQVEDRQVATYHVRNEDTESRELVIEHPVRAGWNLGGTAPAETTPAWYRFKLTVAPKTTATMAVEEVRPSQTQFTISTITDDLIAVLVREQAISVTLQAALREVMTRKAEIARLTTAIATRQSELDATTRDQQRVRENMQALKGSREERELLQRYVRQLGEQETRLETVRAELARLTAAQQQAQTDLAAFIEGLTG